jgi:hypothetical protein
MRQHVTKKKSQNIHVSNFFQTQFEETVLPVAIIFTFKAIIFRIVKHEYFSMIIKVSIAIIPSLITTTHQLTTTHQSLTRAITRLTKSHNY